MPYRRWSSPWRVHANASAAARSGTVGAIHHATGCIRSGRASRVAAPTVIAPPSLPTIGFVTDPQLSVIVLVYNETESIAPLHEELSGVLEGLDVPYEVVYID